MANNSNSGSFDNAQDTSNTSSSPSDSTSSDVAAAAPYSSPFGGGPVIGNATDAGTITNDYSDTSNPGTTTIDEEFAGSGGIGSPEYMEALRKGHEAAGGEYNSNLDDPNTPGTDGTAS